MQIITTAIIKGGSGKTTTAAALAQAAAAAGRRVLAIDLDPQANLSFFIGADQNLSGSYQLLHGADPLQLIQHTRQGIDVIAASPDLATERTTPGSGKRLEEAIAPIKKKYDYIFIDTPPTMGEVTINALQAATGLLIPLETDNSNIQGLYQITDIAHQIQRSNPKLKILGVLITRYDGRANLNRYLARIIEAKAFETGCKVLATIRAGVAIREAHALQESVFDYAPRSKPAQDYKAVFEMIDGKKKR